MLLVPVVFVREATYRKPQVVHPHNFKRLPAGDAIPNLVSFFEHNTHRLRVLALQIVRNSYLYMQVTGYGMGLETVFLEEGEPASPPRGRRG